MTRKIVIVEDNPADAKTLRIALARCDPKIETVLLEDGARAMQFFSSADGSLCDLILLDLNLPRVSGFDVLKFLKTSPDLKKIPVVVLSVSSSEEDIERCYGLGANSYLSKPIQLEQIFAMTAQLISYWFEYAKSPRSSTLARV